MACAAVLAAVALVLSACGSGAREPAPGAAASGAPEAVENCGRQVDVSAPPRRAVSLDQGTTEILLSLGLADRMVGTAKWTDPVMEGLEDEEAKVPRLAENLPSFERVLDAEPDFVAASFASTLGTGGVAERDDFEELGVPTYLSPSDCVGKDNSTGGDGSRDRPLEMDTVYREVRELAALFGVEERGEELVAELQGRVEDAASAADGDGVTLMYWFSDSRSPYMAGCCGAPGIITGAVGAENALDDTADEWPQVSWEAVADRDPDHLVLGDLTREAQSAESAEDKIAFLESDPVTKEMEAVREERYIVVSGAAMNPSIRTVEGIEQVAEALSSEDAAPSSASS
ncbi:ABC transporter substrate-binding protein [Nocardiopsis sp. LSu2-4]|uniref:ABC transporter substrate-binding protein n=1 Tax=Nocardiopsis suaedae TaxID=3018444 RepID=A0ABT4TW13_9ACTN|nr:ABC transporter substrate-binding protein [Nocardiopsis suaedae]MDA2808876.1 ABC transporter substrate-binding protein [Nocardiopsis suaedae]